MESISILPLDVKLEIFEHLSLNDIGQVGQVNKDENHTLSHERSKQLIEEKVKEEQQKKVEEVEPILSTIISYGIKSLTSYVRFDYRCDKVEIVFLEMKGDASYPFEDFFEDDVITDEQLKTAHQYLDFIINGNISVHTWVNFPFIRHLTQLVITNDHGVNDDSRSHRGDCLYQRTEGETIRRKAFCDNAPPGVDTTDDNANDDSDDDDDDNEYLMLDYKYYNKKWGTFNPKGITWGDIMEGVMNVKGSKSDFWYELISEAIAKIVDNTLYIELDIDFGS